MTKSCRQRATLCRAGSVQAAKLRRQGQPQQAGLGQGAKIGKVRPVRQIALLRSAAGKPVRPESYARADIVAGRVGPEQTPGRSEFDGDASARR